MTKIKIILKDKTEIEFTQNYFWGANINEEVRKGNRFLEFNNCVVNIESIEQITWEKMPDTESNKNEVVGETE